jgi:hypothetical protein
MHRTGQSGAGKKADSDRERQRTCEVPATEPPQAVEYLPLVMILNVGSRSIQAIRCAGGEVVDCLGTLPSGSANGRRSRMEGVRYIPSRFIQLPAGRPAQFLH